METVRFAKIGTSPIVETITWAEAPGDPRAVDVVTPEGDTVKAVWASGSGILADLPELPDFDPNAPHDSPGNQEYFNSPYWNVLSLPLRAGVELISQAEFEKLQSGVIAAVSAARVPRVE